MDAQAQAGDLDGEFRVEGKAVGAQANLVENGASEGFVAGFDVGEVLVGHRVAEARNQAIAQVVVHGVGQAQKARAVHHVGLAFGDEAEQRRVVARVVLQVGVLHDDDLAGGVGEAAAQGRALAAILSVVAKLQTGISAQQVPQPFGGAIGGAVVHHDDLFLQRHRLHAGQDFLDGADFVVRRDHHGNPERAEFGVHGAPHGVGTRCWGVAS